MGVIKGILGVETMAHMNSVCLGAVFAIVCLFELLLPQIFETLGRPPLQ